MIHMPDAGGCFVELMNALHFSPSRPSLPNLFFPLTWYEMKHVKFYLLRDPRFLLFYSSWAVEGDSQICRVGQVRLAGASQPHKRETQARSSLGT